MTKKFMNYLKSTIFIFLFLISPAFAGIKILEWEEESKITDYGRHSKYLIKIQAVNLANNQIIDSFSINSSSNNKLITSRVKVNAFGARSLSLPGSFEVFFDKPLKNNEAVFIEYEAKAIGSGSEGAQQNLQDIYHKVKNNT
jgi:hypothetical protein